MATARRTRPLRSTISSLKCGDVGSAEGWGAGRGVGPRGTRAHAHSSGLHPGAYRPPPLGGNGSHTPPPNPAPTRAASRLRCVVDGGPVRFARKLRRVTAGEGRVLRLSERGG